MLEARHELSDEVTQLRLLLNSVMDYAIYLLDPAGYVKIWGAGGERVMGYAPHEIVGSHFSCFYVPEDVAAGTPQKNLEIARREGRFAAEDWRLRKDGSRFLASVVIDSIVKGDELIGYAKVTRDITEHVEAQERLRVAEVSLMQTQKMEAIGKLTLGIAHDFNNLLGVVINALELISVRVSHDPRLTRNVDAALRAAERGALLTRQLVTFGRGKNLTPQMHDVNGLIRELAELMRRSCPDTIHLQLDLSAELPVLCVDRAQLEAAVFNMVINSRDAMPDGGEIIVRTEQKSIPDPGSGGGERSMLCVSVTDDGVGIPTELQQRVFEPFFTTKEIGKGSGLGLSQIFGFAAQSGGFASLESTPGKGTSVHVHLPVERIHD